MNKKSQISFFIIIGILIFVAFSFLVYLNDLESKKPQVGPTNTYFDLAPIKNFVEACLKDKSLEALELVSSKGGYYADPNLGVDYLFRKVPYYYHLGNNLSPTIGFVEESISNYVEDSIPLCINDFVDFPGLIISSENTNVNTRITKEKVLFSLNYPITAKNGDSTANLEDFTIEFPIKLIDLYNAGFEITKLQIEDSNNICLSCLTDIAIKNNVSISAENYDKETILFKVTLNTTLQNNEIIKLIFANKYLVR